MISAKFMILLNITKFKIPVKNILFPYESVNHHFKHFTLMFVLHLRVKRVSQESQEETVCQAKKDCQDFQESRCVHVDT